MTSYGEKGDKRRERVDWSLFPSAAPGERCVYENCSKRMKDAELILLGMPFHVLCFRAAAEPGIAYKHSFSGGSAPRFTDD